MPYMEIITVYFKYRAQCISTLCGKNVEIFNVV